jgi:ribulose kinase
MRDAAVGVDLGATLVRAGVFTPEAELLAVDQTEIQARDGSEARLQRRLRHITG